MRHSSTSPAHHYNLNNSQPLLADSNMEQKWSHYVKFRDAKTKEILLTKYSYLVRYVLGRMKVSLVPYLDHDDLESAGIISLIQSLDRFDPTRGFRFETFAYRRIQGGILDYLRKIDFLSRSSRERIRKFKTAFERLTNQLGRSPSDEEIMAELNIDLDVLKQTYFELSCENPISLESKGGDSSDENDRMQFQDGGKDSKEPAILDQLISKESVDQLARVIETLPERERNLISLYYYDDLTFKEIGTLFHVSESRICQMHTKTMLDIEEKLNKNNLTSI